jgi:hypothetical protein
MKLGTWRGVFHAFVVLLWLLISLISVLQFVACFIVLHFCFSLLNIYFLASVLQSLFRFFLCLIFSHSVEHVSGCRWVNLMEGSRAIYCFVYLSRSLCRGASDVQSSLPDSVSGLRGTHSLPSMHHPTGPWLFQRILNLTISFSVIFGQS